MQQFPETFFTTPLGIICLIAVGVFAALIIVAEWKILTKAGEKGWQSLIPIYNVFISHHIVGMSHVWFVLEVITWIIELVLELVSAIPESVGIVFGIAAGVFTIVSELIHILKMCNCFKKGLLFKIGMIILPYLFLMVLAFSKAEYTKPKH